MNIHTNRTAIAFSYIALDSYYTDIDQESQKI